MTGDGLTIAGGANGLAARFDDLHAQASLLDAIADDLGEVASTLAGLAVSSDIPEAAVLCPVEAAQAEEAILAANLGRDGVAVAWARAQASVAFVRFSIAAYQQVDAALDRAGGELAFAGGFVAGSVGVPALAANVLSNPLLAAALWANRGWLADAAQEVAYDQPWIQEVATRTAPGVVEGAFNFLLGGNPVLLRLISGGHWPTSDLQGAVGGLLHIGGRAGLLEDSGRFSVRAEGSPKLIDLGSGHFTAELMRHQDKLGERNATIHVASVDGPSGRSFIVQIPGTQQWAPTRRENPVDLTSNAHLVAGNQTRLAIAVAQAMRQAGIPSDAPVMLTGHSQGGLVAAAMARDPQYQHEFNIRAVLTAGSPIARVAIPSEVAVLSIEERQDVVPKLDGANNPDRPSWVTVTGDLADGRVGRRARSVLAAHSVSNYLRTSMAIDVSSDPAIVRWRDLNSAFFGRASLQRFQISAGGR